MPINVSEAIDMDTGTIVGLFNRINGGYVDGVFVDGKEKSTKAIASVQKPTPEEMNFLEGGERTKSLKTFYLNKEVYTSDDTRSATEISHRGVRYKVIHAGDWLDYGWFFAIGAKVK